MMDQRRYVDPQAMRLGEVVTIRLRAHPQAPIERVLLRACPDGEQTLRRDAAARCERRVPLVGSAA